MKLPVNKFFCQPSAAQMGSALVFLLAASPLTWGEWQYRGQNTLSYEYYNVDGADGGLYSDEGAQSYNDFSLSFSQYHSPYNSLRGYLQASSNNSAYRQPDDGHLNSFSLIYQNGEQVLPFRIDAGDFFASQSQRTLQRGLKGMQVELQPVGWFAPQSIQLFWGRSAANYDNFFDDGNKDYYGGGSWLIEASRLGSFALTSVNYRNEDSSSQTAINEQVSSLAWEKILSGKSFDHALEIELSYLDGKNTQTDSLNGQSRFLQLTGYGRKGQDYLLSYERNSRDFSPQGASVLANRESLNMQWGQKLYGQMNIRLRGQGYIDSVDEANQQHTQIYGINLLGLPFQGSRLNTNVDISQRLQKDDERSYETENTALSLNLALPINNHWRSRAAYQWQRNEDKLSGVSSYRRLASLGVDLSHEWLGWQTSFSPSLNFTQDVDGEREQSSHLNGGVVFNAQRGGHALLLSHQQIEFKTENDQGLPATTTQSRVQWRSDWQRNSLLLNLDWYRYDQQDSEASDSHKASIAWTHRFEKPTSVYRPPSSKSISLTAFNYLDDLQLKQSYGADLTKALADSGWTSAGASGAYQLYEGSLIPALANNRQVLALAQRGRQLDAANLLVSLPQASAASIARTYQQALDSLLKTYGAPVREQSIGELDENWRQSLNNNQLIRIVEWETQNGILRFGLPRPKAGDVRLELQLREAHPALDSNDWGINLSL